jgi:hypothetical protein
VVNVRLQAVGLIEKPLIEGETITPVHLTGGCYERETMPPGARFEGEALVFQMDSTIYIPPGWSARVDAHRNLILES